MMTDKDFIKEVFEIAFDEYYMQYDKLEVLEELRSFREDADTIEFLRNVNDDSTWS